MKVFNRLYLAVLFACLIGCATARPAHAADWHWSFGFKWGRNPAPAVVAAPAEVVSTAPAAVTLQRIRLRSTYAPCAICQPATTVIQQPVIPQPVTQFATIIPQPVQQVPVIVQTAPPPVAVQAAPAPAPAPAPVMLQQAPPPAPVDRYWLLHLDGGGTMSVRPVVPRP